MTASVTVLRCFHRANRRICFSPHRYLRASVGQRGFSEVSADGNVISRQKPLHLPVMASEVVHYLAPCDDQVFIDMTFGAGGHTREILKSGGEGVRIYAVDRDPLAYDLARNMASEEFPNQLTPILGRFSEVPALLKKLKVPENSVDGIFIDAGCSSMQFDQPERGFSVSKNGPLDMRMDGSRFPTMPTAADVVNTLNPTQLAKIFKVYGDEKQAKQIARAVFDARFLMIDLQTTKALAEVVALEIGTDERQDKLHRKAHSATKVFQALRIFVNNELNELNYTVEVAHRFLKPGGRLVALTFHSLEDRIIKRHMMGVDMDEPFNASVGLKYRNAATTHTLAQMEELHPKQWAVLAKGVVLPCEEEVYSNPRSRSAKLRAASKL